MDGNVANISKRRIALIDPICSVYPNIANVSFRRDLNRTIFPYDIAFPRTRANLHFVDCNGWWETKPFCTIDEIMYAI